MEQEQEPVPPQPPPPADSDNGDDGSSDSDDGGSSGSSGSDDDAMVPSSVDHSLLVQQVATARQAMQAGAPQRAAPFLLRVVHTVPALLPELEGELAQALSEYAGLLVGQGKAREALWLLDGATRSLPQGKLLWLEQGRLCFRLRQHLRALRSVQRALAIDPRFHAALDALESLKSLSVDRWHFRMLVRPLLWLLFHPVSCVVRLNLSFSCLWSHSIHPRTTGRGTRPTGARCSGSWRRRLRAWAASPWCSTSVRFIGCACGSLDGRW